MTMYAIAKPKITPAGKVPLYAAIAQVDGRPVVGWTPFVADAQRFPSMTAALIAAMDPDGLYGLAGLDRWDVVAVTES